MSAAETLDGVRTGHRALLHALRELADDLEAPAAAVESERGAVAFLRRPLLPFAAREEGVPAPAAAGCAAPDHAFLAAEIDALHAEARALACAGAGAAELAAVRRRVHRLQALLELHLAHDDQRQADGPVPPCVAAEAAPAGRSGPREMDERELRGFLAGRTWGVLSTVGDDGTPYAVPVAYGWDGRAFFLATGAGRKLRNLEANGAACLTVFDVVDGSRWRCVVASGRAVAASGLAEAARGLALIARQQGTAPSPAHLARAARGRVFRLQPGELSGRARS